jgi:hypothetical protein
MASTTGQLLRILAEAPDTALLAEPASWNAIKENAVRFGVAALVAYQVRKHVSNDDRQWCDRVLAASWGRYEGILRHLDWTLSVLDAEGIRPLALKGPLLARRHYDPPFLRRSSGDLDLAIRTEELNRAAEALVRTGYKLRMPVERARLRSHHIELTHPERPLLELHFRLSHGPYGLPVDEFFAHAIPTETPGGRSVLMLDAADEIMHLALHFAHSTSVTLFHLCEIRRVWMQASPEVRAEAVRRAEAHHFAGVFALIDVAFRAHWGEPLLTPDISLRKTWLHSRLNEGFYKTFERRFEDQGELTAATKISRKWMLVQTTDRPVDAVRMMLISARTAWLQAMPMK